MKRALVTGGTGFIGRHLVAELVRRHVPVKCLVRSESPPAHLQHPLVQCVVGDLSDADALATATQEVDTVYHLAGRTHALTSEELDQTNGAGCGRLAEACLSLPSRPRVVYVSSLAAAGPVDRGEPPRDETDPCRPVSDYGRSKRLGEIEFQKRADQLPCTVVRPGIVLGPYDHAALPMFRSVYRQRLHLVVGMTTPCLSIIGVEDLVDLLIRSAERGETLQGQREGDYSPQGYYFACDDRAYPTYAQLGRLIADALNRRALVWPVWRWVGRSIAGVSQAAARWRGKSSILNVDKVREATVGSWSCSARKAGEQLSFAPQQTLEQRIRETADWYRQHDWI